MCGALPSKQLNVQIFATTHSLECLDAVLFNDELDVDELSVFRMQRQREEISCKYTDGEMAKRIRKNRGFDLRF